MAIKTPHELFLHDLAAAYYSENTVLKGMQAMLQMAKTDRVKQMLNEHIRESQQQVHNLEQCFSDLGVQPQQAKSHVADGLVEDFRAVSKDIQDAQLIDLAILAAMDKTEHFEIAAYRTLINQAKLMGHTKVANILARIESDEEKGASMVEKAEVDLGKQIIGKAGGGPSHGQKLGL